MAKIKNPNLTLLLKSVSTDETRYHLTGVFFDGENWVSTDGHRMTVVNKDYLPMQGVAGTIYESGPLADGHLVPMVGFKYPDWTQLLPETQESNGIDMIIPIWFKDVKARYRGADNPTPAINHCNKMGWTTGGSPHAQFRVNLHYLAALAGLQCKMYSRDALSPIVFKGAEWTYVLMPMRR